VKGVVKEDRGVGCWPLEGFSKEDDEDEDEDEDDDDDEMASASL
jgi:hypothetical protein